MAEPEPQRTEVNQTTPERKAGMVTPTEFGDHIKGLLDKFGKAAPIAKVGDGTSSAVVRELTFPSSTGHEVPKNGRIHVAEINDPNLGIVYEVVTEFRDKDSTIYNIDPSANEATMRTSDETQPIPNLYGLKAHLTELQPNTYPRLAKALDKIGAHRQAARARGEQPPKLTRKQIGTRTAAVALTAALAAGAVGVATNGEGSNPAPSGPGIEGPAVPGQEQETQAELQAEAVKNAQSIIDDLKNPNLKAIAEPDGRGYSNSLPLYRIDGQVDCTQAASVSLKRTEEGENYILVNGLLSSSSSDVNTESWATYGFKAPEGLDTDDDGTLELDEFRDALTKPDAQLQYSSIGTGVQTSDPNQPFQEIAGDRLLLMKTPTGWVVTNLFAGNLLGDSAALMNGTYVPYDEKGMPITLRPVTPDAIDDFTRMGANVITQSRAAAQVPHGAGGS